MFSNIYLIVRTVVIFAVLIFVAMMLLRLIFNYSDPNPFGKTGRFSFKFRKLTERFVYPAARFFAGFGIDVRLAPLLVILITCVFAYFALQIVHDIFFIIDGLTSGVLNNNLKVFIGYFLYAALSVYMLLIFLRILSSWFVFTKNTFFGFVRRVTDPVMIPLQRLIPTVGMFDISALILLIVLRLLQQLVMQIFVYS